MSPEKIRELLNSPNNSIFKATVAASVQLETALQIATKKKMQIQNEESRIEEILLDKIQMLEKLDSDEKQLYIQTTNETLAKEMQILKQEIALASNTFEDLNSTLEDLKDDYLTPLLDDVAAAVKPTTDRMKEDFREALSNDTFRAKLDQISKRINFNADNFKNRFKGHSNVKYLRLVNNDLAATAKSDSDVLNDFCGIVGDDPELSQYAALIQELCNNPEHKQELQKAFDCMPNTSNGKSFIANASESVAEVNKIAANAVKSFEQKKGVTFESVTKKISQYTTEIESINKRMDKMTTGNYKRKTSTIMNKFDYNSAQSYAQFSPLLKHNVDQSLKDNKINKQTFDQQIELEEQDTDYTPFKPKPPIP